MVIIQPHRLTALHQRCEPLSITVASTIFSMLSVDLSHLWFGWTMIKICTGIYIIYICLQKLQFPSGCSWTF